MALLTLETPFWQFSDSRAQIDKTLKAGIILFAKLIGKILLAQLIIFRVSLGHPLEKFEEDDRNIFSINYFIILKYCRLNILR